MAIQRIILTCFASCTTFILPADIAAARPNILWLSCEDISPHLGCYGYPNATTPSVDTFAGQSVRYTNAFVTAGVCAPCRSAIITGMYQTSLGTQHMRCQARLPDHVHPFPRFLREAGYFCTNNSKEDYQFKTPKGTWDQSGSKAHWKNRPEPGQPFFAVFNFTGCHESAIVGDAKYNSVTEGLPRHDRDLVAASLPPYYPDTPVTREDWGRYYDVVTAMDVWFGEQLRALDDAGLADNTIVFFWSDHGVGLPRAKRWLYDSGMHVPLIVRIPESMRTNEQGRAGTTDDQLISLIDLGPTVLNLAGIPVPSSMQGRAFLGSDLSASRAYVFGARDRMDERYDIIRATRDKRYRYIRNYEPFKPFYQYINTAEKGRTMMEIRRVEQARTASPEVAQFLAKTKPREELYDTVNDPHEMQNLIESAEHRPIVERMRQAHLDWVLETRDLGLVPEAEIHARQSKLGSAWAILNGSDADTLMHRLRAASSLSLEGSDRLPEMIQSLADPEPAVRYWAAIGIGNQGMASRSALEPLRRLTDDPSENVRIAVARALCAIDQCDEALPILTYVLNNGSQWARVQASIVLDELDERARPVISTMQKNLAYREDFVADGKYTVRVLNRALNELLGTDNQVP